MGYLEQWDEFEGLAQEMVLAQPTRTRYSFKYRAKDAVLVLKVTDDVRVLKYKTLQRADVRKLEVFTDWMMKVMSANHPDSELASVVE